MHAFKMAKNYDLTRLNKVSLFKKFFIALLVKQFASFYRIYVCRVNKKSGSLEGKSPQGFLRAQKPKLS